MTRAGGPSVVVVGGGQAGIQAADSVRAADQDVPVIVVGDEPGPPYQRPPLSKSLWKGTVAALPLRPSDFFAAARIEFRRDSAVAVDRDSQEVRLRSGERLRYRDVILATGARARRPTLPGAELDGVLYLRTLDDAAQLQHALDGTRRLVILGGGFIGLEVAASAAAQGIDVTILELAPRVLNRAMSEQASAWVHQWHASQGVDVRVGASATRLLGERGRVVAVAVADGPPVPADVVLLGVGSQPRTGLAEATGLAVEQGVVVDEYLRTNDPAVWAIGDCASFPLGSIWCRVESVQNAIDQGRRVGDNIVAASRGEELTPYRETPWFWSQQGAVKIQIVGVAPAESPASRQVVERRYHDDKLSYLIVDDGRLVAVESFNASADHLAARKLIAAGAPIDVARARDVGQPLKALLEDATERPVAEYGVPAPS